MGSREKLMATGMWPIARPCSTRPTTPGTSESPTAQITEPMCRMIAETTRTGSRPLRSASCPESGMATPLARSVAVTSRAVFEAEVPSMAGSSHPDEPSGIDRGRHLEGLYERLDRLRRRHQQGMSLGAADLRILWLFTDGVPRTPKQIAQQLDLEKSRPPGGSACRILSTPAGRGTLEMDVAMSLGEAGAAVLLELFDRFLHAHAELAPVEERADGPRG